MAQEKSNRRIATTAPSKNTEFQKVKYSAGFSHPKGWEYPQRLKEYV